MQVNAYFAIFVVMLVLAYSTAETGARPGGYNIQTVGLLTQFQRTEDLPYMPSTNAHTSTNVYLRTRVRTHMHAHK